MKNQDILFWLVNVYLFLEYVRPQTLYPALDILPYAQISILICLSILLLRHQPSNVKNRSMKLIWIYFAVIVISSSFGLSPRGSFEAIPEFIAWMIVIFLISNIVNDESRFIVFILAFLIYSFKMAQFSFRNWIAGGMRFFKDGTGGGPGWFHNSGEFGIQMCIFLALSACFYLALSKNWGKWKKMMFLLFPLTALAGTISSSSRGALLGAMSVVFWLFIKSKNKAIAITALIIICIITYLCIPEQQLVRFHQSGVDVTSISRINLWSRALDIVRSYPFLGVGYNNWGIAQEIMFGLENQKFVHNAFLQCATELGYLGFMVYLFLIFDTFYNNYMTRTLAQKSGNTFIFTMAHGLDAALIGYLVSSFFVTVLYYPYFWINLAMSVSLRESAIKTVPVPILSESKKNKTSIKAKKSGQMRLAN